FQARAQFLAEGRPWDGLLQRFVPSSRAVLGGGSPVGRAPTAVCSKLARSSWRRVARETGSYSGLFQALAISLDASAVGARTAGDEIYGSGLTGDNSPDVRQAAPYPPLPP